MEYSVWYVIPTANPPRANACLAKWKAMGYGTAALVDRGSPHVDAHLVIEADPYPGYFSAVNRLCHEVGDRAHILVTGGDDVYPDPRFRASQIAEQFFGRFPDGLGVMQPTGDTLDGTDRICGSPWMGLPWVRRAYQGKGPFWGGYRSYYGDEELKRVAELLERLWMNPKVNQFHDHWLRPGGPPKQKYQVQNEQYWGQDQALFKSRESTGFPGHELLEEKKVAYSQGGEEAVILKYFGESKGRFLDIGAFDGKTFSNTLALAERGWSGVCVEASPRCFKALQELHGKNPNITLICAAVASYAVPLVKFWDCADAVGTTDEANKVKWEKAAEFSQIWVSQIGIHKVLELFPGAFDFINIDTEGTSVDILLNLPLSDIGCRMVCVEHDDRHVEVSNYGRSHRMEAAFLDANNLICCRR